MSPSILDTLDTLDTLGSLGIPSSLGMAATDTETETEGSAPWAKAEA